MLKSAVAPTFEVLSHLKDTAKLNIRDLRLLPWCERDLRSSASYAAVNSLNLEDWTDRLSEPSVTNCQLTL
jgi:hypothetical protein